ncbi:MAG: acyl-CoA/acyl-ACP dehydrogenase [Aquabacterium sp.]|uniref:acyl-CoA dehydrogenase family protein n=1 Tax=Aquabacterium sp. TaxID=1872578 RepID=UPI0025C6A9D9|nr:acyl-CoA dehydrogenase family protein [Aquabacterium sp.]MBI5924649.1 acyl-CoA/acyl-ACP dehydrogenase [Aquabacterium sp.]
MTHPDGAYLPSIKERSPSVDAERLRNSVADWSAALAAVSDLPSAVRQDVVDALELAQRFNAEVVRPWALQIDRQAMDDPAYIPRELIRQAGEWGLFTLWLPVLFGGKGWNYLSLYAFLEEVASACAGVSAVIGVHYMGQGALMASWNLRLAAKISAEVCAGERRGEPCLMSLALNEPLAGTDTTDTQLLAQANLVTQAVAQPDGSYILRGRKNYISNGHVSTWHMVVAYEDLTQAADTMVVLAVRTDMPGVRVGEMMDKMGQRACVASELIFEDVHVPADCVAIDRQRAKGLKRPYREVAQTLLDYISACTRSGVGAFAAGVARGSYEAARDYAARKVLPGGRLIEQQWAQTTLAEMNKNAILARQAYLESALANGLGGLFRMMFFRPLYWADQLAPASVWRFAARRVLQSPDATQWFQKRFLDAQPKEWQNLISGLASLAKFASADLAMSNAGLALELTGADGLRHEIGIEKRLRDAKLLQIHEGTDQINRVNLFKCRLRPDQGVRVFMREDEALALPDPAMNWLSAPQSDWWRVADQFAREQLPGLSFQSALDHMHGLGWANVCGESSVGTQASSLDALYQVLEALSAVDASMAAAVYGSAAAHLALRHSDGGADQLQLRRELAGEWLAWPAFHGLHDQLWPAVDAQGYLRGQVDMLMLGGYARWAVLPVQGRDQLMHLAVVDLTHPAVIRGERLLTLGLSSCSINDVELGGVPCEIIKGALTPALFRRLSGLLAPAAMAMLCGVSRASLQQALAHASSRQQGGGNLLGWGEVRRLLSAMQERLSVMQGALQAAMSGALPADAAQFAALQVGAQACELTVQGVQLMGGDGYRSGSAQGQRMKDARQLQCLQGGLALRRQHLLSRD